MLIINLFITILIPLVFGLMLLSLCLQKEASSFRLWEKLGLAFPLGLGFLTIIMFLLGTTGIPATHINIIIPLLIFSGISGVILWAGKYFCLSKNDFHLTSPKLAVWEWFLVILIGLKMVFIFFSALIKPMIDVDAFQQYSIVAKGVFFDKTFTLPYLQQFMGDKPPLPFLTQGWVFIGLNQTNDAYLKILSPILFLCLLVCFYCVSRRFIDRVLAILFTFFLSTLPFIVYHTTTAYADVPITVYYSMAGYYLFLFMSNFLKSRGQFSTFLTLALVLLGLVVWTKKAGLVLSLIAIFVTLVFLFASKKKIAKPNLKQLIIPFIILILIITPWLAQGRMESITKVLNSIIRINPNASPTSATLPSLEASPKSNAPIVFSIFLRKLFLYGDWHLSWGLLVITLIFYYQRAFRSPYIFLLAIILLDLFSLFVQFGSGETFRWLMDGTLLDRLVMNEVPLVIFFCALVIQGLKEHSSADENHASSKTAKGSSSAPKSPD